MWQADEAGRCQGCGLPVAETFDPANQGTYVAHWLQCHACAARDEKAAAATGPRPGAYYRVDQG